MSETSKQQVYNLVQNGISQPSPSLSSSKQDNSVQASPRRFLVLTISIYSLLLITTILAYPTEYRVAVVGTNDLHGRAFPTILFRTDTNEQYKYGGLVYMATMMRTLKNEYQGNIIYLDGGDQFQGGVQSSKLVSSGQIINDFFNYVGLNASSIGNHEFDFGLQFLLRFLQKRSSPNLAANLQSQNGEQDFLPNQKPSELFSFPNGIKIGVIGLATLETPATTAGFVTKQFPPYRFLPYRDRVIKQSNLLKKRGANAILIVSHVGDACSSDLTYSIRSQKTQQPNCTADELSKLIDDLPEGTVHGVVQGHRHFVAHHYYKGIPYMGSINGGYYFNKLEFRFNSRRQLIDSQIEGPIPVCQKIFEHLGRCEYLEPDQLGTAGQLVNWKFHQKLVEADPELSSIFRTKYAQQMKQFQQEIVKTEIKLERKEEQESQLSNLFTNLLMEAAAKYSPDFALINTGGFRSEWTPGVIQQHDYYNMFPFENEVQTFELTGGEIVETMRVVQNGRRFIQACRLVMEIAIDKKSNTKSLEKIRFSNGTEIEPGRTYTGVSLSFLIQGGDQFSKVIGTAFQPKNVRTLGEFRSTLKPYLRKLGVIRRGSLISQNSPRLIVRQV